MAVVAVVVDEADDALVEAVHLGFDQFGEPFEFKRNINLEDVLPAGDERANREVCPSLLASPEYHYPTLGYSTLTIPGSNSANVSTIMHTVWNVE